MNKINKNYVIMGLLGFIIILLVLIIIILCSKNQLSFSNKNSNNSIGESVEKDSNSINDDKINSDNLDNKSNASSDTNNTTNTNNDNDSSSNSNNNSSSSNNNVNDTNSSGNSSNSSNSEEDVVSYFQNEEAKFSTYNENNPTFREKAKNAFITVIDFIFYNKEIKGHTFNDLTTSAKLQVIKIALTIDHKIEEYFPNYKDTVKDKYKDIKGQLAVKYLEFTSTLCDKVGSDTCNQAKEDFNNMKSSFGFTWSMLKELATSGKDKIKDYYENEFRN